MKYSALYKLDPPDFKIFNSKSYSESQVKNIFHFYHKKATMEEYHDWKKSFTVPKIHTINLFKHSKPQIEKL